MFVAAKVVKVAAKTAICERICHMSLARHSDSEATARISGPQKSVLKLQQGYQRSRLDSGVCSRV